jgi:NADP-dependent 3-hydroxy acid dehydrogenase YdfG
MSKENKDILFTTINPGGIDTPLWNENNPYNGDKSKLLKPEDIANLVGYIAELPNNVVFKNATVYPVNEEH